MTSGGIAASCAVGRAMDAAKQNTKTVEWILETRICFACLWNELLQGSKQHDLRLLPVDINFLPRPHFPSLARPQLSLSARCWCLVPRSVTSKLFLQRTGWCVCVYWVCVWRNCWVYQLWNVYCCQVTARSISAVYTVNFSQCRRRQLRYSVQTCYCPL